jgi:tRNA1(Val) A37 N6-methylase TrmN6
MDGLKKEPLGKFEILVRRDHTFGTDAVLLADFAGKHRSKKACDIGTGCGIIPLLLLKNNSAAEVHGVELQPAAAEIAKQNAVLNGVEAVFSVHNVDMKEVKGNLPHAEFDLVTCNPPYKVDGGGNQNLTEAQRIARHEVKCVFSDVVAAAKHLLKFGGRLCICHRPERLADIMCDMREHGIEPKVMREVIQREGKEPWLVLVEGKLGGNRGMQVLAPLYVEKNGQLTDEMIEIYGDYKEGHGRKI